MKRKLSYIKRMKNLFDGLVLKKNRNKLRNSDLSHHSFVMEPEPLQRKKRLSFLSLKEQIRKQRRVRLENCSSFTRENSTWRKTVPAFAVLFAVAIFFLTDGVGSVMMHLSEMSFFRVRNIVFTGCEATSEARLGKLAGIGLYRSSMIGMNGADIEARIEADQWVSNAVLRRDWPSTVIIDIVEHKPIALMNTGNQSEPQLNYVDKKGIPFLPVTPGQDVDYPIITGLDTVIDRQKREDIFGEILIFLTKAGRNDPNLPVQSVSEVHVNAEEELVVYLVEYPFPIFFGRGEIATKYSRLVRVLASLYRNRSNGVLLSRVEYIQMNYLNDKVLVAQSESG